MWFKVFNYIGFPPKIKWKEGFNQYIPESIIKEMLTPIKDPKIKNP